MIAVGGAVGLTFSVLGPLRVERDGLEVPIGGPQPRALLALLLLHAGDVVPLSRLTDELWGERPPRTADQTVRGYVAALRAALDPDRPARQPGRVLRARSGGYQLDVSPEAVDAVRFEALCLRGARELADAAAARASMTLRAALELWRGEPYAEFAELTFASAQRGRLQSRRLTALGDRIEAELALGQHGTLVSELEELVGTHPEQERLRGQLMLALYRSGRQADALRVYAEGRSLLADELGIDPGPELQSLQARILQQDETLGTPTARQAPTLEEAASEKVPLVDAPPPIFATRFIGRDTELRAAVDLLRSSGAPRLLTLVGPGGTGKTRLVVELAHQVREDFRDGVAFVPLAPLEKAADVVPEVLRVLGVPEDPSDDIEESLYRSIKSKHLLLILDNFEQVQDAAQGVADLLDAAPHLSVLVTSRRPLNVTAERELKVEPLTLPAPTDVDDVQAALRSDAVQLFVERAAARAPLSVTPDNVSAITTLCRQLDGLPLALELAAARSKLLSPQAMTARLDHSLALLSSGPRDLPLRQRTLRSTLDWSYRMLNPVEARTLAQLSVFTGGWTLEAAEAVCTASDLLDVLAQLLDKSMITGSAGRLRMLRSVREYASEQLLATGDAPSTVQAYVTWCVDQAEQLAEQARSGGSVIAGLQVLTAFDAEMSNLLQALHLALEGDDGESLAALVTALNYYWFSTGRYEQSRRWLAAARSLQTTSRRRGGLLWVAATSALYVDANSRACEEFARESSALLTAEGVPDVALKAAVVLGHALHRQGKFEEASSVFAAVVEDMTAQDYPSARVGNACSALAAVRDELGDTDAAEKLLRRYHGSVGTSPDAQACACCELGALLVSVGQREEGEALLRLSLESQGAALPETRVDILFSNSVCELAKQRTTPALHLLEEALGLIDASGYRLVLGDVLSARGVAAQQKGELKYAARLFGAGEVQRQRGGLVMIGRMLRQISDRAIEQTRQQLGGAEFQAQWDLGAQQGRDVQRGESM